MKKRFLVTTLCLLVLIPLLAVQAFAATVVDSGKCGDNLKWTLTSDGTLTISGTGEMWQGPLFSYEDCKKIYKLVIEEGITSIGEHAFEYCDNITNELMIPDGVTSIESHAFYGCQGFTGSLVIPDSVTSIGERAFQYCSSFTGVKLGESLTVIGLEAFSDCTGFEGDLIIPDSVVEIAHYAFQNCTGFDGKLILGKNIKKLYGFNGCSGFSGKLVIPDSVVTIGFCAFSGCEGFEGDLVIPDSVVEIEHYAFENCKGFDGTLTIGKNVKFIKDGAFEGCDGFYGNLTIPNSVASIGAGAFMGCYGFTEELTIPNSVTSIGDQAFWGCNGFEGNLIIPDSVTCIGGGAFGYCTGFAGNLTIPNGVISIGEGAFEGCSSLTGRLVIPDSVTNIGDWAFRDCSGFTGTLTLPKGLKTIGRGVFYWCHGFTWNLTIPNSVTSIGELAFARCFGFTGNLAIPDSVTKIDGAAFEGCEGLEGTATLPNGLKRIREGLFNGCYGISQVCVPQSVIRVDQGAFQDCYNLRTVYYGGTQEQWQSINIYGDNDPLKNAKIIYSAHPVKLITQPKTTYTKLGASAKATVKAEGDGLIYTWYVRNANATKYTKSSVTGATYSVKMSETVKDRRVYCVITDQYGNKVQTDTVLMRMAASITAQPTDAYAAAGEVAKVNVSAAGDGLTYTWYIKNASGTKFSKSSVTGATYSAKMSDSSNGRQVYCVVKDKYGKSVTSNTVTLNMSKPLTIITQPKTTYTQNGTTAKVTVKAEGDGLTYQWYIRNANASTYSKSSITSATYSVKMSSSVKDRRVYCIVKDQYGNTVQTKTVLLRMAASITSQPANASAAKGKTVSVTVGAAGDGLTYTWYIKNASGTKFSVSSVTGATYSCTMSAKADGRQVYCVVTDKYGNTVKSNVVTLFMK